MWVERSRQREGNGLRSRNPGSRNLFSKPRSAAGCAGSLHRTGHWSSCGARKNRRSSGPPPATAGLRRRGARTPRRPETSACLDAERKRTRTGDRTRSNKRVPSSPARVPPSASGRLPPSPHVSLYSASRLILDSARSVRRWSVSPSSSSVCWSSCACDS